MLVLIHALQDWRREQEGEKEGKRKRRTCHAPNPMIPTIINIENVLTLSFVLSDH